MTRVPHFDRDLLAARSQLGPLTRTSRIFTLSLILLGARGAVAQDATTGPSEELKAECATAYAEAQRNRQAGKQMEALKNAVFCAQEACPQLLVGDCTRWIGEIEASMPTIVLEARDDQGNPLSNVQIAIDHQRSIAWLNGRAWDIDPGEHHFYFEHDGRSVERRFVVVEGKKNQRLVVTFPRTQQPDQAPAPGEPEQAGKSPLIYVPLGLAVLGGAGFAYFGLKGNAAYDELEGDCAPRCSDAGLDPVRRDWLLADVSLGVSVVSLGVFGWLLLSSDGSPPPAEVDVSPAGAAVRYRARF